MKRSSLLLTIALGLALTGASCSLTTTVKTNTNGTVNQNTAVASTVRYSGQDGKNALELLQSTHQVDVSAQGFVNAIDGRKPGDHQFWAYYVNGKQADVGAKEYQAKAGETIEWKLESY